MIVIGTIFGSFFGGIHSQCLGRKNTILTSSLLFVVGISCIRFGSHYAFLFAGLFIVGFAAQYLACVIPAYTSEISQPKLRRLSGTFFVTFFSFGGALMFLFTAIFEVKIAMVIILVMALVNFTLVLFCPKSPTWLMNKGHKKEAFEVLKQMRGCEMVANEELKRIEDNIKEQASAATQNSKPQNGVKSLLQNIRQPSFLKPLSMLGVLFLFGLQISGATTIPIYFITLLKKTGVTTVIDPHWAASSLTLWRVLINVITTMVASRTKRRPLFLFSGLVCATGWLFTGLSVYFYEKCRFKDLHHTLPWVTYFSMGLTITGYASGFVMVSFMLLGELLPSNLRGLGTGLILFTNNLTWLLMVSLFPLFISTFGLDNTYFIFSGIMLFVLIFGYFFIPETYGLTLEKIERGYRNRSKNMKYNEDA